MSDHTMKAFDTDLQDLARMVAEMGGLAEKQVADSVDALAKRDTTLAQRVTAADVNTHDCPTSTYGSRSARGCRRVAARQRS
jgi:phosphate uptake regulator